ncbi:MAG: phenylacetate-CoA oxygenase subunit PaaC [Bacteroidetes bacterium]|nr:phenylacetate-CoA oxygenase subunit PaaC [Bacteroidota bacterium]
MTLNNHLQYILFLADSTLILSQRNSEWCAHGPILEQDIAITNISLDLLGQARNFYQHAANLLNQSNANGETVSEDSLAYLRNEREFKNLLITELPNGDWAQTILRQFFFSVYQHLLYSRLLKSEDKQIAAIAEKSLKEITYHIKWSREWVVRLGDGTEESNRRIKAALDYLWMYTGEFFIPATFEESDPSSLREQWLETIKEVFEEATLELPAGGFMQQGGKTGNHTEYLGYILAEMQTLQRTYPGAEW